MPSFFINNSGDIALEVSDFQVVDNFSEGLAPVVYAQYFFGFIDKSGNLAFETPFVEVRNFSDGLAVVKTLEKDFNYQYQTKWGVIDKTSNVIFDADFDKLYNFSESIAVAERANEIFFVDKRGEILHSLNKNKVYLDYNGTKRFSEGLIAVCDVKTDNCGFMNKTGEFVIEPRFKNAANFSEGKARVSIIKNHHEYLGFINTEGDYIIEPKFDIDSDFLRCSNDFSEGLASLLDGPLMMNKDANFIFINELGEVVINTNFFRAENFHEGLAMVWDEHKNKYGYIDRSGNLAIPLKYTYASDFSEGLARISF